MMVGTAETFALFYAVKQHLNTSQIAIVSTLPILLGALAQWLVPSVVRSHQLKKTMLTFMGLQIAGLGGLFYSFQSAHVYEWIVVSLSLYWIGGLVCGPIWLDWISAWLEPRSFCRFLSRRNAFVSTMTLMSYVACGLLIHYSTNSQIFRWAFLAGMIFRAASWLTMYFQPTCPHPAVSAGSPTPKPEHSESAVIYWVIVFTVLFKFAVNISSPFFLPYMVKELKFSLLSYVFITAIPFVGRSVFLSGWGEAARTIRPFMGLPISMAAISIIPILWTFSNSLPYLGAVELMSGLLWGGFDLCAVLIVQNYWAGSARRFFGLHLSLMSLASLLGAKLGASLLNSGYSYRDLFLFSSNIRILDAVLIILILSRFKTTRAPLRVYGDFLSTVLSIRPSFASIGRLIPLRRRKIWNERPDESSGNRR